MEDVAVRVSHIFPIYDVYVKKTGKLKGICIIL